MIYKQITGFENKQYCLYESFPAWYKQCEWHAKFIAGAIFGLRSLVAETKHLSQVYSLKAVKHCKTS